MRRQLANTLLAASFLGMATLCVLQSGARWCKSARVAAVTRTKTLVDIRGDKNRDSKENTTHDSHGPLQKVVILTYMRSGSSLTGNILQQSPEVFYVYEPLWYVQKVFAGKISNNLKLATSNTTITLPLNWKAFNLESIHYLQSYLNCRLEDLSAGMLMWTTRQSYVMEEFNRCTMTGQRSKLTVHKCIQLLSKVCQRRKVSAVKIIRGSMREMHFLLNSDPNVKVIHLVRDPRGALRSRNTVGEFKWTEARGAAIKMCSGIWDDLQMAQVLRARYPGRILNVRYEDIVAAPIKATQQMYDFLALKLTPDIRSFVWNSTYGGLPDDCVICTTRTNATLTAYRWRTDRFRLQQIMAAQSVCADVMRVMGYKVLANEQEILDINFPSTLDDFGVKGMLKVDIRHNKSQYSL